MAKPIAQILSNETMNSKGFIVMNDSIDWSRYKNNPILLRNPDNGEHYGKPIGRVENIRLADGAWQGELKFDKNELGKESERQYNEGILNGVSIFGMARIAERNGRRYTTRFEVMEISLVNIPSNPDAVAIREKKEGLSVSFITTEEEYIEGLSAYDIDMMNKIDKKMEEVKEKTEELEELSAGEEATEKVSLSAVAKFLRAIGFTKKDVGLAIEVDKEDDDESEDDVEEDEKNEEKELAAKKDKKDEKKGLVCKEALADDKEGEEKEDDKKEEKKEGLSATEKDIEAPMGLAAAQDASVFNVNKPINNKAKTMVKPFSQWIEDEANMPKLGRIMELSASSNENDGVVALSLSDVEDGDTRSYIQELAASMKADPKFMAAIENINFDVNGGRKVPATETIAALAAGHGSAQFIQNADLAKISWLSLFVRQLFPNDRWAGRLRRVSVRDRAGVIWVESAMNPEVYFGDVAPVNAKNYLYSDTPRGLSRKVLALQPIIWQTSNTQVLAYNDRAVGQAEAMQIMATAVHNYWLQIIAESVPAANHVTMSGPSFNAAGRFPINPAATGNLNSLTVNDLIGVQGRFLARNLGFSYGSGVAVLAEPYFTGLQQSETLQSILTRQLSDTRPDGFNYGGFDVMVRSMIAGYDTATSAVVDAEKYFDKKVNWATGAIEETHTPPVLTATTYDIGLAFMPEEIVVGIGETNIHMVSDPNSYGWKMSMDMATGAGTLRSGATGIALLRPTVAAGA